MMIHLAFVFGLLGNIVSFMVYLAPVPTFYKIYKKKSTEGFQSVPYVVGLFSAMLWIYYAFLKPDTTLLITINSVGCFIQTFYICFFLFYATKKAKMDTMKLLLSMNVVGLGLIILLTQFFSKGSNRAQIVGWICLIFSFCVFVAPLGVLRQVIRTKSVEYMPFQLSFFLTLSAVMWFFYGLLRKDYNIAIPNVLGFTLGLIQMALYLIYKNAKKVTKEVKLENTEIVVDQELKLPEEILKEQIIDVVKLSAMVCSEIIPMVTAELKNEINLPQLSVIINEDKIIKPKAIKEAS
ncbi:bidirectional sugar transporter SWEET10-like [Solanum dulcamara]|uniref:bidirectional sugar transporter SWEET10-like n=1 Tax=Solanum dulcamara TaxID=45834 RepID=UPI002485B123|nr:bidirectional sugar transporter SWEET10-like [Solanum dulcamara]